MTTLSELRQASLQEQKKLKAEAEAPARDTSANEPATDSHFAGHPAPISETEVIETAPAPPAHGRTPNGVSHSTDRAAQDQATENGVDSTKAVQFMKQVHRSLSHKTMHDNGTRVTVDMPVSLFHRAKRYCVEHGNVTLRQVLLDLLRAYLDEEGY